MTPNLTPVPDRTGPSGDPNDQQFGDVVDAIDLADASDYDAVLCGEPYDGAVIGRAGAAAAPDAVRESLAAVKTHHFDSGPVESVGDVGDVVIPDAPTSAVQETVAEVADALHESETFPVFVGGDNSLSYPNVRPLLEDPDTGRVGVVSFDAHLDCREVVGEPTSGSPYRQLHDDGLDRLAVVGARHFETSTAYAEYLDAQGGCVVTAEEVGEDTVAAVDHALDALVDVDTLYVSVDVDVLDAAHAPGVSAPTPGGVSSRELFRALRLVASDDRLAGFEVVECAPRFDEGNRTVDAASRAIAHVLASHD